MGSIPAHQLNERWEYHLLLFSALIALASILYIPYSPGPSLPEIAEVVIPFGISIGLAVLAYKVQQRDVDPEQLKRIVSYGWAGALIASVVGGWWITLHLNSKIPVVSISDHILTVLSAGIGAGVLIGYSLAHNQSTNTDRDRGRVLAESCWMGRSESSPILEAVLESLAEAEGVIDPNELDSLYESINPETFSEIRRQDNSQWQLLFHTEKYEVRVSGLGTVTVYETDPPDEPSTTTVFDSRDNSSDRV